MDETGRTYNVEIQRRDEGADAHRARYNSSLLDANLTSPGDRYDALGETYVIFITERDVLHEGLPIYHIDRYVRETGKPFEDGSHILYVNAQCRSDTPLGKLMHDFHCTDARDMNYPVLAERVHYFKDNVKGATNMCRAVEQLARDERAEGREEGTKYGQLKTIRAFMDDLGIPFEQAMKAAKIPESDWPEYKQLLEGMGK